MLLLCHSLPQTVSLPPKFVQARNHPSLLPFRAKVRRSLESPNAHPTWKHAVEAKLPSIFFSGSRTSPQQNHASLRPSQLTVNGIDYSFHIHTPHSQHPTFSPTPAFLSHRPGPHNLTPEPKPPGLSGKGDSMRKPTRKETSTFWPQ